MGSTTSQVTMFSLSLLVFVVIFTEGVVGRLRPSIFINDGRIVGGANAKIEDYPYMAGLEENGLLCGASVVTNQHVVTAAHCLENYPNVNTLLVRVGTAIRENGGQTAQVRKYVLHPKYTKESADYDVAVVELKNSLVFGSTVQPIRLQEINREPAVGSFAKVTGWGYTNALTNFPLILQVIEIPRVSQEFCEEIWGVTPRMICYGFEEGGKGACGGDSGGPLVSNGKLAGVVSFGGKCAAPNEPGGYTNIANKEIHDFIESCIGYY